VSLSVTLGIRPGAKVSVVNPPPGFVARLNPLPDGVEFLVTAQSGLDLVLFFVRTAGELVGRLPALARSLALPGRLWVCWENGKGLVDEEMVRHAALDIGLVDDKRASIDGDWVGLRLIRQSRPRPARPGDRRPSIADA
jgi:hypothetical protein